jgi:hypothetical protein
LQHITLKQHDFVQQKFHLCHFHLHDPIHYHPFDSL